MGYSELNHDKTCASLYTTLPVVRWDSFKTSVSSWQSFSFIDTTILVNHDELISNSTTVDHITSLGIGCCSYCDSSEPKGTRDGETKRTPSLNTLFDAFRQGKPSSCYIYSNADIYLGSSHSASLAKLLKYSIEQRKIVFVHRWDVSKHGEPDPRLYDIGFDLFIVPASCLNKIDNVDLSSFFIGQVGWDYALPLSLPRRDICKTSQLPIEHLVHPTTSTESWSSAMLETLTLIHKSHIRRSASSFLAYKCIRLVVSASKLAPRIMPLCLYRHLASYLRYINSRLSFYGFIRAALSSLPEWTG